MPVDTKQVKKLAGIATHHLTDAQWEARGDAWALQTAQLILDDPKRLEQARLWAAVMVETEETGIEAFKKVANA